MSALLELEKEFLRHSSEEIISLGGFAPVLEACVLGMEKRDWVLTGPRGRIVALLRGASVQHLLDNPKGSRNYKIAPSSDSPSHRALQAIGLALSSQRPVLCILGVSALGQGSFFEALNILAQKPLPVILVVIKPTLEEGAIAQQLSCSIVSLAQSLGVEAESLSSRSDGITELITQYRNKNKPACIEIQLEK